MTISFPKDLILNGKTWKKSLKFNIDIINTYGSDLAHVGYRVKEDESSEVATLYFTVVGNFGDRMDFEVLPEDEYDRELMYVRELPTSVTSDLKYNVTNVYNEIIGFDVIPEDDNVRGFMYVKETPSSSTAEIRYNVSSGYDENIGFEVIVDEDE